MKQHELTLTAHQDRKRVGRGIGSGHGKTAGRGTKGQNSRTGKKLRPGFEGGQNPLAQRIPKLRGFKSRRLKAQVITTGQLNAIKAKTIDNTSLAEAGLIKDASLKVKLLLGGEVKRAIQVKVNGASKAAKEAVEAAGGAVELL